MEKTKLVRGCGKRQPGGVYGCCPLSPTGTPVWEFLLDPPIPYNGCRFRDIIIAPPEISGEWTNGKLLLLDWVSAADYPSVASFVEEVRRFGLSRRFRKNFPWDTLAGKKLHLGLIHERACPQWVASLGAGNIRYRLCDHRYLPDDAGHQPDCVYHSWLTARLYHGAPHGGPIDMPWGPFDPDYVTGERVGEVPQESYVDLYYSCADPGVFAVFPISHFEVVKYVPGGCDILSSSEQEVHLVDE